MLLTKCSRPKQKRANNFTPLKTLSTAEQDTSKEEPFWKGLESKKSSQEDCVTETELLIAAFRGRTCTSCFASLGKHLSSAPPCPSAFLLQPSWNCKPPCSVSQGEAHSSEGRTHKPTHKETATSSSEKYIFRQIVLRNVLLFIVYPTNVQELMPKKYKVSCYCWERFFFLQHCPTEIILTRGAWRLMLWRWIFPTVNWYFT